VVSYYTPGGHYAVDQNVFNSGLDAGVLHALSTGSSGGNGVYAFGASAFPSSSYAASNYWVDAVFNTLIPPTPTPTNTPLPTDTPTPGPSPTPTPTATATITPTPPSCPCTVFTALSAPVNQGGTDANSVELGMKFRSDADGFISGARFYKLSNNPSTHTAHLWSSTGTLLATATFSGETSSGWQQVNFIPAVAVTANTTYVVSYYTPGGHYAADQNSFTVSIDRAPLHGLSSGSSAGNGVYAYGSASSFPSNSYAATNYWVDAVFNP
jgi:hypothetical protein